MRMDLDYAHGTQGDASAGHCVAVDMRKMGDHALLFTLIVFSLALLGSANDVNRRRIHDRVQSRSMDHGVSSIPSLFFNQVPLLPSSLFNINNIITKLV